MHLKYLLSLFPMTIIRVTHCFHLWDSNPLSSLPLTSSSSHRSPYSLSITLLPLCPFMQKSLHWLFLTKRINPKSLVWHMRVPCPTPLLHPLPSKAWLNVKLLLWNIISSISNQFLYYLWDNLQILPSPFLSWRLFSTSLAIRTISPLSHPSYSLS